MSQRKTKIGFYERATGTGGSTRYLNSLIAHVDPSEYEVSLFCTRTQYERFRSLYERAGVRPVFLSDPYDENPKGSQTRNERFQLPFNLALLMGYVRETMRLAQIFKENPDLAPQNNTGAGTSLNSGPSSASGTGNIPPISR